MTRREIATVFLALSAIGVGSISGYSRAEDEGWSQWTKDPDPTIRIEQRFQRPGIKVDGEEEIRQRRGAGNQGTPQECGANSGQ